MVHAPLDAYQAKRDFARTAEPRPASPSEPSGGPLTFVVQKHAARRLHYDVRLELDGVLKSFPIPKGPSYNPRDKRLAVMTEDHPLEYAAFEGLIPAGEYGGGQVIVWDAGIYGPEIDERPCWDRQLAQARVRHCIERGKLSVFFHGQKLRGGWTFVRTRSGDWLCLKKQDATADPALDVTAQDRSVLSGLTIADLQAGRLPAPQTRRRSPLLEAAALPGATPASGPPPLAPMLPTATERPFSDPLWLFEPKLDGFRIMAVVRGGEARLFSRRELEATDQYPWLVRELEQQPYRDVVLDGEVVAVDGTGRPSFQLMQNRASDARQPLYYYVFDVLHLDGVDVRGVPLEQRRALLRQIAVPGERLRVVDAVDGDGAALYEAALRHGMEGVVAKRRDSRYESGRRSTAWLKVKATHTEEFVVGGYTRGEGARSDTFGSLLLGCFQPGANTLTFVGHVGTGFDARGLRDVLRRLDALRAERSPFDGPIPTTGRWGSRRADGAVTWLRPELLAEVKFAERTDDGILRTPVFLRLRDDKAPSDARPVVAVAPPATRPRTPPLPPGVVEVDEGSQYVLAQLEQTGARLHLEVDGSVIPVTNLDKDLWPAHDGQRPLTKRDLLRYLVAVAPALLRHLRDRPLTLVRYPNGIDGVHFYQKHYDQSRPAFVETVRLYSDHNAGDGDYILGNSLATLVWLGQLADLEFHTWYSRVTPEPDAGGLSTRFDGSLDAMLASTLNYPDFLVFDLDPYLYSGSEPRGAEPELHRDGFAATCQAALWLKEILDALSLASFVKTTGRTGLHVYVPIVRNLDYGATHTIAETLARFLAQSHPREVTVEWAVSKRTGKVFADYNQNVRGKTLASIYSPRVLPRAAVSMPIDWQEVGSVFPTDFTILTAPARLKQRGDLWRDILDRKQDLNGLLGGGLASAS